MREEDLLDLAVIGMACRLPGAANLKEYWDLLLRGGSAIQEFPADRLDRALYYDPERGKRGKTYSVLGGIVPDVDDDSDLAGFPTDVLTALSSGYRHLLAVTASAFREAALDPRSPAARRTGFFAGQAGAGPVSEKLIFSTAIEDTVRRLVSQPEFQSLPPHVRESLPASLVERYHRSYPQRLEGGAPIDIPAHGSTLAPSLYGWVGPVMTVDAACASSLVAITAAADSLAQGQCDLAVVVAASEITAGALILFSQAQALGVDGSLPFRLPARTASSRPKVTAP